MRVTDNMRLSAAVANEARLSSRLYDATKKAASGVAVDSPADDPVAFAAIATKDAAIARMEGHLSAAERARGDAELAEGMLAQAANLYTRAKEIAVDMANGDKSGADRAAGAKEVTELRSALLSLTNTRGSRGYLFAGTKTDAPPFDPAGAFTANDGVIGVEVADGVTITANSSGAKAFTAAGGRDLLADLATFATALSNDDQAGVQGMLDLLDQGHRQLVDARGDAGMTLERLGSATDVASSAALTLRSARSRQADADPVSAYTELAEARNAYEQSLAVTKQILSLASSANR